MRLSIRAPRARATALHFVIGAFGAIWLANAAFQAVAWLAMPSAKANLVAALTKAAEHVPHSVAPILSAVLEGTKAVGTNIVAVGMVVLAALLGIALLTRTFLACASVVGIIYSLVCWLILDGLGFPYTNGQTDPGVFMIYAIAFLFVLSLTPVVRGRAGQDAAPHRTLWKWARLSFGLLWLFDAALKWLPAFLFHFSSQITSVIAGQPDWIAAWLRFVAEIVGAIGPVVVAIVVAVAETAIASALLSERGLRFFVPFGLLYSLAVWSTAESFGGPYTAAGTGVRGNVIGNIIIYLIPFLLLWIYPPVRDGVVNRNSGESH